MNVIRLAGLALLPVLILSACGGDDDDSDAGDNGSSSSSSSPAASGGNGSSKNSVSIPAIKDGSFGNAKLHIEVSGGKDTTLDLQGSGLGTNGLTLLGFSTSDGSAQVTLQGDSKSEQGGLALTTKGIATGGGWGSDCSVKVDDGAKELKGEFDCKQVDGVEPGGTKTYKVRLKGTFSATRE